MVNTNRCFRIGNEQMEIDNNYGGAYAGIIVFPEYAFADLPLQPSQIIETVSIGGSSSTAVAIQGVVND